MKVNIRADSVEIEGYVNAIERNSKPLMSRIGQFIERICKGAFSKALKRNEDVHILLNHDWDRDLGSTKQGNLELTEDNIGLHARAVITDRDVVEDARNGNLVGWSFGFEDVPDGVVQGFDEDTKLPVRKVRDLNLYEVSVLNREKCPAYDGTLIMARSDDQYQYHSEAYLDEVTVTDHTETPKTENVTETRDESPENQQEHAPDENKEIDYSEYERMIAEMKGEEKP